MTVKLSDIRDAQKILKDIIIPTPLLPDVSFPREIGAKAHLKAECLQKSGSFKIRGAYNKIHRLSEEEKRRGVITASAGNHAQGVALAARLHNIKSIIVLPEFAPLTKINATKNYGAEVHLHGATFDEAVAYSKKLQEEHGYNTFTPLTMKRHCRSGNDRSGNRRRMPRNNRYRRPDRRRRAYFGHCSGRQRAFSRTSASSASKPKTPRPSMLLSKRESPSKSKSDKPSPTESPSSVRAK